MRLTKHAKLRIIQRGIKESVVDYMEFFLNSKYENQSNKILLTRKNAVAEAKKN